MKYLLRFNEEKSIGSEAIRLKWYSDIDKTIFYKLVKIDPTSVRKKEFSKPGKYVKWLIKCYKKIFGNEEVDLEIFDSIFNKELNYFLFIFSTGWYQSRVKKGLYYIGGVVEKTIENDIFKFKNIYDFTSGMRSMADSYKAVTEDAKYDVVFSDDKVDVLIPMNFSASFETAKNTDWCSQSFGGYSGWSKMALLFRIIPKSSKYDKLKLTWRNDGRWYIACSKYPEINNETSSPFKVIDSKESWVERLDYMDNLYKDSSPERWLNNSTKIRETMSLLSKEAKDTIEKYYDKNKKVSN
jgi:hypothetical protein